MRPAALIAAALLASCAHGGTVEGRVARGTQQIGVGSSMLTVGALGAASAGVGAATAAAAGVLDEALPLIGLSLALPVGLLIAGGVAYSAGTENVTCGLLSAASGEDECAAREKRRAQPRRRRR